MKIIVDIIFILLSLIMISWTIWLRTKEYKKMEPYIEEKCLYKSKTNKIVLCCYVFVVILFLAMLILDIEFNIYNMVWIVIMITNGLASGYKFNICENGLYFNDFLNKPVVFIPYEKINGWHFNKFNPSLLTIKSEVKSSLFNLPEFKIKKEDVDKVNKILLNCCGEKKDR